MPPDLLVARQGEDPEPAAAAAAAAASALACGRAPPPLRGPPPPLAHRSSHQSLSWASVSLRPARERTPSRSVAFANSERSSRRLSPHHTHATVDIINMHP
eukprot:COSAG01_NODE_1568_length_9874_cov_15.549872_8_plen_101_part_00